MVVLDTCKKHHNTHHIPLLDPRVATHNIDVPWLWTRSSTIDCCFSCCFSCNRRKRTVHDVEEVVLGSDAGVALHVEELRLLARADGRVDTLGDEQPCGDADDDQGDDPSQDRLEENPSVDALASLEQRNAGGGADLPRQMERARAILDETGRRRNP